jgi:uncharacterized lipoprotein YbaY
MNEIRSVSAALVECSLFGPDIETGPVAILPLWWQVAAQKCRERGYYQIPVAFPLEISWPPSAEVAMKVDTISLRRRPIKSYTDGWHGYAVAFATTDDMDLFFKAREAWEKAGRPLGK